MSVQKKDIVENETDDNQEQELEQRGKINDEFDAEVVVENIESKEVDVEFLQGQLEKLQEQSKVNLDKVVRAQAEMENLRKRAARDVENAHKFGLEKFTQSLLPVLDSLEKAIETSKESDNFKAVSEGVELTMKMLVGTMDKFGINQINPQGEVFDPNKHEAMAMQANPEMTDNQVMSVFQTGYELNNRVVRPARVLVVKNA